VEDEESLKTGTVIGETTDLFKYSVDEFFTDSVVSSGVYRCQLLHAMKKWR
jgi:hypothetical protein